MRKWNEPILEELDIKETMQNITEYSGIGMITPMFAVIPPPDALS